MKSIGMSLALLPLLLACAQVQEKPAAHGHPAAPHGQAAQLAGDAGHGHATTHQCPGKGPKATRGCPRMQRHDAHAKQAHRMTSDAGSTAARWAADEPLRQGMARVRNTAQALVHFEHGRLDAKQVAMHADELRAAVDFIFAECRLAPEPDAALHPLLAQLIGVSKALKELPTDPAPIAELHAALARYAQLFDESGVTPAGG